MASLSLREAAEQAGTSKSTIWRAIKSGRMSAARNDDGEFAIDASELFRVFHPKRDVERVAGQGATPVETPETPAQRVAPDETAVRLAALDAEIKGLRELLAEVRANRDEVRADRDDWRGRAERLLTDHTDKRSWWRRFVG